MIQAIPTMYRGVQFRSRLEARWAVFFDALGVEWHYEHEGYQLPSGWYLPDFWLPKLRGGCFVEIKLADAGLGSPEHRKCCELANATAKDVFLLHGSAHHDGHEPGYSAYWFAKGDGGLGYTDLGFLWCICPRCGQSGIEYEGRGSRVCGARCYPIGQGDEYTDASRQILGACDAARVARFW